MNIKEIRALLFSLKKDICDDYRVSDDPDDDTPGICVTIATTNGKAWDYQTCDNSFTGSAYGFRHWAVISLYRDSNCLELAREAIGELRELIAEAKGEEEW